MFWLYKKRPTLTIHQHKFATGIMIAIMLLLLLLYLSGNDPNYIAHYSYKDIIYTALQFVFLLTNGHARISIHNGKFKCMRVL